MRFRWCLQKIDNNKMSKMDSISKILKLFHCLVMWSICNRLLSCQPCLLTTLSVDLLLILTSAGLEGTLNKTQLKFGILSSLTLCCSFFEGAMQRISYLYLVKWIQICYVLYSSLQHCQYTGYNKYLHKLGWGVLLTVIQLIFSKLVLLVAQISSFSFTARPHVYDSQLNQFIYAILPEGVSNQYPIIKKAPLYAGLLLFINIMLITIFEYRPLFRKAQYSKPVTDN